MDVWWRVADYREYKKRNGLGNWDNGVLSVSLRRWARFSSVITPLLDLGDFVWRGQRQDWPLLSKFQREVGENRPANLLRHTLAFARAIKGRRGTNPPELENDVAVWSLGQHYGLPTPLLDWTESPFVAAYFAFHEDTSECDDRSRYIYGLSWDITRWGPKGKGGKLEHRYIVFENTPSDENARLLSQKGLFTVPLQADVEIEDRVQHCYATEDEKTKDYQRIILVRIKILNSERIQCLRSLNQMNINHATLFPDLTGAAEYCAMKLKIPDY